MRVPPTINLEGEIILTAGIISISYLFIIPVSFSLFFRAAYRLLLYSGTQNGFVGELRNVIRRLSVRGALIMGLHLVPVFFLLLKSGLIMG